MCHQTEVPRCNHKVSTKDARSCPFIHQLIFAFAFMCLPNRIPPVNICPGRKNCISSSINRPDEKMLTWILQKSYYHESSYSENLLRATSYQSAFSFFNRFFFLLSAFLFFWKIPPEKRWKVYTRLLAATSCWVFLARCSEVACDGRADKDHHLNHLYSIAQSDFSEQREHTDSSLQTITFHPSVSAPHSEHRPSRHHGETNTQSTESTQARF